MALFGRSRRKDFDEAGRKEPQKECGEERPEQGRKEQPREETGRTGKIGREEIARAMGILEKYKAGKKNLEARIIENEQWYKLRHWEQMRMKKTPGDPEPASAWLLNSIMNKHADAMDNYPEPAVLPREASDRADAEMLSAIMPVVLEQNEYEQTYSDGWWYKLKTGTGVTGVFWAPGKHGGLGDIDIRCLDLLNLFWEPGITDIQKSQNLFHVDLMDRELLWQKYPFMRKKTGESTLDIAQYVYDDTVDTTQKTAVIDWYYKREQGGKEVLHYCKFCSGEVLYASENDPAYAQRGFYDHGKYPVIFDVLFPEEGSPAGFGYIDICKSPQMYIDKMDQIILKNAVMQRPRFFIRGDGAINEEEYADWSKDFVHFQGAGNPHESIIPVAVPPVSDLVLSIRAMKIDELKETSGNRDFSQGGTVSGVTAATAIAALQEAGSKLSRDMLKSSYRAFAKVCYFCIELMRQFYTEDRWFRIVGEQGRAEFVRFNGARIAAKEQGGDFGLDMGYRVPIFDIRVNAQKASPFSTAAQNERAKELYGMGFFRPDLADQALAALDMMRFDGIEEVRSKISGNGTMYEQIQQMQQQMQQMAAMMDSLRGAGPGAMPGAQEGEDSAPAQNSTGSGHGKAEGFAEETPITAAKARMRAANMAGPGQA